MFIRTSSNSAFSPPTKRSSTSSDSAFGNPSDSAIHSELNELKNLFESMSYQMHLLQITVADQDKKITDLQQENIEKAGKINALKRQIEQQNAKIAYFESLEVSMKLKEISLQIKGISHNLKDLNDSIFELQNS